MIIQFLSQAESELKDAASYYEGELEGLGRRPNIRSPIRSAARATGSRIAALGPGKTSARALISRPTIW
jgi:hypothetical protein